VKQAEQSVQERAFLSIQWLSIYLGIKPKSVYAMVEKGQVPHYRVGKLIRFKRSEIDEWMKGNKKDCVAPERAARKALGPLRKPKNDVERVVRKAIDGTKGEGYTKPHGKPDQVKGLGKEVPDGTV
jgi:excisionase family DNA binding protein